MSQDVKSINADIDDLRNSSEIDSLDFNTIEILSKHIGFDTHPLYRLKEGRQCQMYLEMLLNIVRMDRNSESTINRMVFMQWLQQQSLIDWSLEELYKDTFKNGKESYYDIVNEIPEKYRDFFVLDTLVVGNISRSENREIQEYIVDLATILGIDNEKLGLLAIVAKAVLCQDLAGFTRSQIEMILDNSKQFKYYLPSYLTDQAIIDLRVIDVELSDEDSHGFKWTVKNLENVFAGEVIATYKREKKNRGYSYRKDYVTDEIVASESGTLYQFRHNKINYGIISHATDGKNSIKAWVKERKVDETVE
jgi:hypothetical protein